MHRRRGLIALLLATTLFGAAIPTPAMSSALVQVAVADNAFGFRLLNAVQRTVPNRNVVLSPVSAALNLSMVLNGTDDQTRQEMLAALSLSGLDIDAINTANAQLIKMIRTPATSITLSVAGSLWVDSRRATLRPDYIKRMQALYDAETVDLDFSRANSADRINSWVSKETSGKISKVIEVLDPADVLLLLNAVYFKGEWSHKFDKTKTKPRDFTLEGGSTKQVPRMEQSGHFGYFETPEMQAIRLPFGAGDLVMEVLLPAQSSRLGALEAGLTPDHWKNWQGRYTRRPGTIELPRFELKSNHRLNGPLQSLGMRRAFDSRDAQLTGMLSPAQRQAGRLSISSVLQSTYWKVDEEGSEAAAVTLSQTLGMAPPRPEQRFRMIVDRPFFCAIQDRRSGVLLFLGAIYDPTP